MPWQAYQMEIVSRTRTWQTFANYLAVPGTTYEQAMFNLLIWVESQDEARAFSKAAQESIPELKFEVVMAKLRASRHGSIALRPDVEKSGDRPSRTSLKGVKFEDVGVWIDALRGPAGPSAGSSRNLEPVIAGYGTGYPCPGRGDDQLPRREDSSGRISEGRCRGAPVRLRDGTTGVAVSEGVEHELAKSWGAGGAPAEIRPTPPGRCCPAP